MRGTIPNLLSVEESIKTQIAEQASILIVTAADAEHDAVIDRLEPLPFLLDAQGKPRRGQYRGLLTYYIGLLGSYLIVHTHCVRQGDKVVPIALSDARHDWPGITLVIMPGMAFGLHSVEHDNVAREKGGQVMGDIVVATEIIDSTRKDAIYETNPHLVEILRGLSSDFEDNRQERVFFGPMLVVPAVVRDETLRNRHRESYGLHPNQEMHALAGEMEGLALANVEQEFKANPSKVQLYILLAKSISDWGFNKPRYDEPGRSEHEVERRHASRTSVEYLLYLLNQKSVFKGIQGVSPYNTNFRLNP